MILDILINNNLIKKKSQTRSLQLPGKIQSAYPVGFPLCSLIWGLTVTSMFCGCCWFVPTYSSFGLRRKFCPLVCCPCFPWVSFFDMQLLCLYVEIWEDPKLSAIATTIFLRLSQMCVCVCVCVRFFKKASALFLRAHRHHMLRLLW